MNDKKYVLLEIDASRYNELTDALSKRTYIKFVNLLTSDGRAKHSVCPACSRALPREMIFTVNEEMIEGLLSVARAMTTSKTVVLYNKHTPYEHLRPIDQQRAAAFNNNLISKAEQLGLIASLEEGSQWVYHLTDMAISFLFGKAPLTPCKLAIADGIVLERSGSMMIEDVKSKDKIAFWRMVNQIREIYRALPDATKEFIKTGQASLI